MYRLTIPTCLLAFRTSFPVGAVWSLAILAGWIAQGTVSSAAEQRWDLSPYRIKLHLAVDTARRPQPTLQKDLAAYLEQRIRATLYPLWSVDFSLPTGSLQRRLLTRLDELANEPPKPASHGFDKEMFLVVAATAKGYFVRCREMDRSTQLWGPVLSREVRQEWMLPEQCFDLVRSTFAPLAKVRRIPEDPQHVLIHFKGSGLPRQSAETRLAELGSVYQPLMIRTNRQGEVRPDGIARVPWTYLILEEMQDGAGLCRMQSGMRHPLGVRRRGRVEHLAIAMRHPPGTTRVRFYARHDKTQPLVGYEVFRRESQDEKSRLLGLTDAEGTILIRPGPTSVTTLFLRSDGQLLAKVPLMPGAVPTMEVPIADDTARLNAQAALTSLREQLIDLVARRNILMARIRDRLKNGKLDEAQELLNQLDALPGRAQFARLISSAERNRRNQSDEPRVQARIEKLFADTRKLLGRFLSTRQITELQSELSTARRADAS